MGLEIYELLEKLKAHQNDKSQAQRELEIAKRERNYLSESLKELKVVLESINN